MKLKKLKNQSKNQANLQNHQLLSWDRDNPTKDKNKNLHHNIFFKNSNQNNEDLIWYKN